MTGARKTPIGVKAELGAAAIVEQTFVIICKISFVYLKSVFAAFHSFLSCDGDSSLFHVYFRFMACSSAPPPPSPPPPMLSQKNTTSVGVA